MNTDKLMELERKWRRLAISYRNNIENPIASAHSKRLDECADELAAALRAEQAVGDEQRARELLAEELDAIRFPSMAAEIRDPESYHSLGQAMVRVVARALGTARQSEGVVLNQLVVEKVAENVRKWMGPVGQDLGAGHVATLHGTIMDAIRAAMLAAAPGGEGEVDRG